MTRAVFWLITRAVFWRRALVCLGVSAAVAAAAFVGWVAVTWLPGYSGGALGLHQVLIYGFGYAIAGLVWTVTGGLLALARPRNVLGWLIFSAGIGFAWVSGMDTFLRMSDELWGPPLLAPQGSLYVLGRLFFWLSATVLLALYPDGRIPSRRWWWPVGGAAAGILLQCIWVAAPTMSSAFLIFVGWPLTVVSAIAIYVGSVVRLVRAGPPQRQQLAWLLCVAIPAGVAASELHSLEWELFGMVLVPVAVAVGVLRYRLLGIETVVRRWLVYGTLTLLVFAVYLAVTALAGAALQSGPVPEVLAAAVVAVGLAPARDRLQRVADRIVYGERRDPLRAISRLGRRVADTGEAALLPAALTAITEAVRAPAATVSTADGRTIGAVGPDLHGRAGDVVLPLELGGQQVGVLRLAAPSTGETYTDGDRRLLEALAPQLTVIVQALRLTEALQAERDRVVTATTTERDRLRRDLHDGLGPSLAGIGLGLQALTDLLPGADPGARELVDRLRAEVATAVTEVRRIIDDLRPVALDTMGLATAIRRHATTLSASLPVAVDTAELPPIPPRVETTAYRITTEALTNAARHAHAHRARVSLTTAGPGMRLRVTVADDGRGVDTAATAGVGLASMRRRAETIGGHLDIQTSPAGTTITATLPLEET